MKVEKINVRRGRKLNLGNYESTNLEIGMEVILGEGDDPRETLNGVYRVLNQHLEAWERDQTEIFDSPNSPQPSVQTADSLLPKTSDENKTVKPTLSTTDDSSLICPKCNEIMTKKEGKDYYVCSNHWGYPDMIKKGQVRDKRF